MSTETPTLPAPAAPPAPPAPLGPRTLAPLGRRELGLNLPPFPANPLLDAPAPRTRVPLVLGILIFLVFVVGFTAWATLAPLAEAAIAPGVIKVEGNRRTIQHLEGGIVREILARDGDKVERGQVLMRLDDIQSDTTLETQRAQRWALLAQDARLSAEAARAKAISFPADLLASANPRAVDAVTGQKALFEARTASLNSQLQVLQARIEQQQAMISGARGQVAATQRQLELIKQEETMRRGLVSQGLARLPDLLAVQRALAGLEGTLQDLHGQIERATASIEESQRQMQQIADQRMQEVSTELRDVRNKLAEADERVRAASDVQARREIVAPESGTIVNLRIFTLGAVVRPGDPVMDLMPDHDRLVAEVNVQPNDIDVVYPGLRAEVRLPAFKQRLVPYLHGYVTWVAADVTTNDQTRQQYYRSYILIDRDQLEQLPNVFITPGMPVEAHVQIGQRSFFRYLVQPIRDSFHRAFREQ
jgi:HlyD family secretion protein